MLLSVLQLQPYNLGVEGLKPNDQAKQITPKRPFMQARDCPCLFLLDSALEFLMIISLYTQES